MRKLYLIAALALLSVSGAWTAALGATLFSQTVAISGTVISDAAQPGYAYDDFSLAADASITDVIWRGQYFGGDNIATDDFTIAFFNDTGSAGTAALGTQIGTSFGFGDNVNRLSAGDDGFGNPVYEYSVTIPGGLDLLAGSYWIAIFNDTPSDPDSWQWNFGNSSGSILTAINASAVFGTALNELTGHDTYLVLEGEQVPLPAALPLYASGLGLMGLFGWWRRRRAAAA
jgi:hypothetical protein